MAPVPVIHPSGFLALFAAVFGATATSTFGELTLEHLPLATFEVGTLADPAPCLIFATKISHDHTRPVLHVLRVMSHGELLHQGEDVDIIGQQILIFLLTHLSRGRSIGILIQKMKLTVNLQLGHKMGELEKCAQVAVLGDVSQQLQGHKNILITGHSSQNALGGGSTAITEIQGVRGRGESGRIRIVSGLGWGETQSTGVLCVAIVDDATVDRRPVCDVESLNFWTFFLRRIGDG